MGSLIGAASPLVAYLFLSLPATKKKKGLPKQGLALPVSISDLSPGVRKIYLFFFLRGAFFLAAFLLFGAAFFFLAAFFLLFGAAFFFFGFFFAAALAVFNWPSNFLALFLAAATALLSLANFFFACPSLYWICLTVAIISPFLLV
jgi:hypothetical protein